MESSGKVSEDEEEVLVYVEFEGLVDSNVFNEKQLQLDMVGIDTEHPIMQINGKFYEGVYEDVGGTYMFFTKNNDSTLDDPVFDTASNLKYFAKTRKCLKMRRIFIKPRAEVLGDSEHEQCIPNLNTLKQAGVPIQYQKEALSFWKTMRNNRLNALHSYLEKQRVRQEKKSQGIILESESDEDNPFAMYSHKEEIKSMIKSEDICVNSEKESNYSDNSPCTIDETSNNVKDNFQNDFKPEPSTKSESLVSIDVDCHSPKPIKAYKAKVICKKNLNIAGNRQRVKLNSKRSLLKDKISSFNVEENKLSGNKETKIENESRKRDKSNITESLSALEITTNKNEK
ncbi:uncharacterized protein LOC100876488 isoform X1 [Megachile rotundata]|uniref:uncharacterized protein LOC100876488 isoform X1 n=1 Tax=Megachile rotundata TaxID=143995 RepID=UPI003FD31B97